MTFLEIFIIFNAAISMQPSYMHVYMHSMTTAEIKIVIIFGTNHEDLLATIARL